jgi:hypothetical protein
VSTVRTNRTSVEEKWRRISWVVAVLPSVTAVSHVFVVYSVITPDKPTIWPGMTREGDCLSQAQGVWSYFVEWVPFEYGSFHYLSWQRLNYITDICWIYRPRWPYDLSRRSTASHCWNHGFQSRLGHICSSLVFCAGSGLWDELITRSEESYRLCVCLIVCDVETSAVSLPKLELGCCATEKKKTCLL